MNESMSIPRHELTSKAQLRVQFRLAWAIVLLLTLPQIILGAFMGLDTSWLGPARIVLIMSALAIGFGAPLLRPMRGLLIAFLVIYGVEEWFFLNVIHHSELFAAVFGSDTNLAFFGTRLLRIGAALVMLLVLLALGFQRRDLFLRPGRFNVVVEAEKWAIPRKPETWPGFGGRFAIIIITIFLITMVPSMQPSLDKLSPGLLLFAALCALLNAFAEEFLYRSALLPQLLPLFGKGATMLLVACWFGLGHYFGMPYGIAGVMLTGLGGWIFAKAMLETQGMGWPLFLHSVADFTIYVLILLAGGF